MCLAGAAQPSPRCSETRLWWTKPDVIPILTFVELIEEAEPTAAPGQTSCLDSSDEYHQEEEQAAPL